MICERCGEKRQAIDITCVEDLAGLHPRGRQYIHQPCECPGPRCPFCAVRLDADDHCVNTKCWFWPNLVPIPEVA